MPYYCCPSCGVTSYSAAGHSSVGTCPDCMAPLGGGANGALPASPALQRTLPARPASAPEARRALDALGLPEDARAKLALLVSELVTNAVRHAGIAAHDPVALDASIDLLLTHDEGEMRLAVRDRGPGFTPPRKPRARMHGGLGLVVIDALSKAWGVESNGHGCTVWCTLDLPAAA